MSFFKHRKSMDPEFMEKSTIEPDNTNASEPVDMSKIYQLSEEYRRKKLEEFPRLEEFENIVKQYVNDYIAFQSKSYSDQGLTWNPTTDSIYFCYTRIKGQLPFNEDKEFRDWYIKTNISEIRRIISHEIGTYIEYRKLHSRH